MLEALKKKEVINKLEVKMSKILKESIIFNDILLVPKYSEVIPIEIDITTNLTRDIVLNLPFMSAGMDIVSEHQMAIAMARTGGIGIIHKNMSIGKKKQYRNWNGQKVQNMELLLILFICHLIILLMKLKL